MNILVINAGSSSLKYQLLNPETQQVLAKGLCERIGIDGKFTYKPQVEGKAVISAADVPMPTHSEAIQAVLAALEATAHGLSGPQPDLRLQRYGPNRLPEAEPEPTPAVLAEPTPPPTAPAAAVVPPRRRPPPRPRPWART